MSTDIKEQNEAEFQNVKYLLTSSMRTLILVVLYNESKNLNEIRNELKKPSATILHGLKELEDNNLIRKERKYYSLTSNGHILATNIIKLINNWYSIEANELFWNKHELSGIPKTFLNKLYLLKDVEFVSSTTSDLSNAFNTYINLISSARKLTIILPIYSENHFNYFIDLVKSDYLKHLRIILNSKILKSMQRSRYIKKLLLENKKVEIIETEEDPKLFLTYSESFMTLTLFFEDGHYDDSQIIIGENKNAIKWAEELFNYYNKDGD